MLSTSCIPHKDTIYYQNKGAAVDTTQLLVEQQKPYRIQINDIISIRVKSLDQESVDILNPTGEGNLNACPIKYVTKKFISNSFLAFFCYLLTHILKHKNLKF